MAIDEKSIHQYADEAYIETYESTFVTAGTRGSAVNLDGKAPIRLIMPSTWINTQSTLLHVQLSTGGSTYTELWSAGTAYTVSVAKSKAVRLDPDQFGGVTYLRLISTLARGTAATQHAGVVTIVARRI